MLISAAATARAAHLPPEAPPRSYRLGAFSRHLYEPAGQQVLEVLGDSINATNNSMSMQVAYRDRLDLPYNGWVLHADSTNAQVGYTNAQGPRSLDVIRDPGETFSTGEWSISPVRARDTIWGGDMPPTATISDSYIAGPNLVNMKRGNPFASGAAVDARLIMYEGFTQMSMFEAAGMRAFKIISSGLYQRPDHIAAGIVWIDRATGTGTASPGIRLRAAGDADESRTGSNTLILLGTRVRAQIPDGVQMQFIANNGWTAVDHADPDRFTDEALRQYYAATDPPTHIIVWLGQNQSLFEAHDLEYGGNAVFKADVAAILDRHERVINMLGAPPPRWLLVSQYKTVYTDQINGLLCAALYSLAQERPNVSYLDMYQITGGPDFDTQTYLADGIHPNALGVAYLGDLLDQELSAAACPAKFDGSGFVDLDDYTAFIAAFEAGDDSADVDESGFVDIEDFIFFVQRFTAGC